MAEENKPKKEKRDWSSEGELPYDKIPVFKAAYDCYKECEFRFRNVPVDAKPTARTVKERLMRVMVCIAHARLNIRVLESLREATDLAIEIQVTLRVMVETNRISKKDFSIIAKYSDSLMRQMIGWSTSEEKKIDGNSSTQANSSGNSTPISSEKKVPREQSLFSNY